MADLSQRPFGPSGKPLADLSDGELRAEAQRRRALRSRGGQGSPSDPAPAPPSQPGEPPPQVRQWYANLEVPVGADRGAVEAAYERLARRYDPERHRGDADKHRAALDLTRSLTRAYRGLVAYLEATRRRSGNRP
jgi:DnaJ-domain-containing protein 1